VEEMEVDEEEVDALVDWEGGEDGRRDSASLKPQHEEMRKEEREREVTRERVEVEEQRTRQEVGEDQGEKVEEEEEQKERQPEVEVGGERSAAPPLCRGRPVKGCGSLHPSTEWEEESHRSLVSVHWTESSDWAEAWHLHENGEQGEEQQRRRKRWRRRTRKEEGQSDWRSRSSLVRGTSQDHQSKREERNPLSRDVMDWSEMSMPYQAKQRHEMIDQQNKGEARSKARRDNQRGEEAL
jgi:hypothetical protein